MVAASVVTGDGHTVEGRDPVSGSPVWSYGANQPRTVRCQLGVPVRRRGVSRQPRLRSGQHDRRQDRQARSGPHCLRRPRGDGCHRTAPRCLSAGDSRLELWRSDMVRMLSYGSLDAKIKPGTPASPLCRLTSAAASSSAVSVLEACPNQEDLRLTLLAAGRRRGHARTEVRAAIRCERGFRRPGRGRLRHHDRGLRADTETGREHRRRNRRDDRRPRPCPSRRRTNATMSRAGDLFTWWTGRQPNGVLRQRNFSTSTRSRRRAPTFRLDPQPRWPGGCWSRSPGGYDVFDPDSGKGDRHIPVPRPPSTDRSRARGGGLDGG